MDNAQILEILALGTHVCARIDINRLTNLNNEIKPSRSTLFSWQKFGLAALFIGFVPFVHVPAKAYIPVEQWPRQSGSVVIPIEAQQDHKTISGKITDEKNKALGGVTIQIKASRTGIHSNSDGSFSIQVPNDPNVILVVGYIGYITQEVRIDTSKPNGYQIKLQENTMKLGEIAVVRTKPSLFKRAWLWVKRPFSKIARTMNGTDCDGL